MGGKGPDEEGVGLPDRTLDVFGDRVPILGVAGERIVLDGDPLGIPKEDPDLGGIPVRVVVDLVRIAATGLLGTPAAESSILGVVAETALGEGGKLDLAMAFLTTENPLEGKVNA